MIDWITRVCGLWGTGKEGHTGGIKSLRLKAERTYGILGMVGLGFLLLHFG